MNDETFEMSDSTLDLFVEKAIQEVNVQIEQEYENLERNYKDWLFLQYEEEKAKELGITVDYFRMEFL